MKKLTVLILLLVLLCTLTACKHGEAGTADDNIIVSSSHNDSLNGESGGTDTESAETADDFIKASDLAGPWHPDPREPFPKCLPGGRDPVSAIDRRSNSDHVCFLSEGAGEEPMKCCRR